MSPRESDFQGSNPPDDTGQHSPSRSPSPKTMAAAVVSVREPFLPSIGIPGPERPRLPPILSLDEFRRSSQQSSLDSPRALGASFPNLPAPHQLLYKPDHYREQSQHDDSFRNPNSSWNPLNQRSASETFANPLKRAFGSISPWHERRVDQEQRFRGMLTFDRNAPYSHSLVSPAYTESSASPYHLSQASLPLSGRSSISELLTPSRTHSLSANTTADHLLVRPHRSNAHRCTLHVRQQPRAARAGPDGKDRRAVDPPPVLQLMLNDFDPQSEDDVAELKSSYFVVHCRLMSAQPPRKDLSTLSSTNDDGSIEVQRLLLGTSVASPFFCPDDPDPDNAPVHPRTKPTVSADVAPPSPTSRFIVPRGIAPTSQPAPQSEAPKKETDNLPGTFFIFADLSIRRAGEYRFEFCLMKVEPSTMVAGSRLPILHSVTSEVFRVVNAKDFDQVQPSTYLVRGLLDRGAGFPLKLKKGTREGGRRKGVAEGDGDMGSIGHGDDEDDENDDDDDD